MVRSQPIRRERVGKPLRELDPAVTSLPERFAEYLCAKRRSISDATRHDYLYPYSLCERWLKLVGLAAVIGSFTVDHLERYADYLRDRDALPEYRLFDGKALAPSSWPAYLRPLDQFGDWLTW